MRLLTHNVLNNNSPSAKGNGYPLRLIQVTSIRVENTINNVSDEGNQRTNHDEENDASTEGKIEFVKGIIPTLHWPALVQASTAVGISTLPDMLQEDMIEDSSFLLALYHILLNVHVVEGILICPATKQQFVISNEIPNFIY